MYVKLTRAFLKRGDSLRDMMIVLYIYSSLRPEFKSHQFQWSTDVVFVLQ